MYLPLYVEDDAVKSMQISHRLLFKCDQSRLIVELLLHLIGWQTFNVANVPSLQPYSTVLPLKGTQSLLLTR